MILSAVWWVSSMRKPVSGTCLRNARCTEVPIKRNLWYYKMCVTGMRIVPHFLSVETPMFRRSIKPGDYVIYSKAKHTMHPGRRARNVYPNVNGEYYDYVVDKYWIVTDVLGDGDLVLETRRGKTHVVPADDPNLRRASIWDRFRHRTRFAWNPQGLVANS